MPHFRKTRPHSTNFAFQKEWLLTEGKPCSLGKAGDTQKVISQYFPAVSPEETSEELIGSNQQWNTKDRNSDSAFKSYTLITQWKNTIRKTRQSHIFMCEMRQDWILEDLSEIHSAEHYKNFFPSKWDCYCPTDLNFCINATRRPVPKATWKMAHFKNNPHFSCEVDQSCQTVIPRATHNFRKHHISLLSQITEQALRSLVSKHIGGNLKETELLSWPL